MALDTRGLASGFAQGFGLADNYYNRQAQNERADRSMEMREEAFSMQKDEHSRKRTQEMAQFTLSKIAQGIEPSEDEVKFLQEHPEFWPALDPQTDKDIELAQRVIDPNDPLDANDPDALYAMNHMFEHRINRGEGGRKRIAGLYPGTKGDTVAFDLEVEREDGTRYNAPMTKNRGTDDDEVLETPVEALVNQVQGYRVLRNAFRTPEAQATASRVLAALTGKSPERSAAFTKRQEMVGLGVDDTTATNTAYGIKTDDKGRFGEPFQHPSLGWVQEGPDGKLHQYDPEKGGMPGTEATDGTGGLDSSVLSQIQQTTRNYHGSFNPDGSFLGIPEGAREKYTEAMERAQRLVQRGLPVFEATNLANLSVRDKLSENEAKSIAEREANQEVPGWFKGDERKEFVERRTQELLQESGAAQRRYSELVGGNQGLAEPQAETQQQPQLSDEQRMQQATTVRERFRAGEITREEAVNELRNLGFE